MSTRALVFDDVAPGRLALVRERVVRQHPGTASAPAPLTEDRFSQLRVRVARAENDPVALDSLAASLNPREVRALVSGLEQWEDLREAVRLLLSVRSRESLVAPLWRSWQRFPRVREIRTSLLEVTERWGWSAITDDRWRATVQDWIEADEPGLAILNWLEHQELSYTDFTINTDIPLQSGTPLDRLVRESLLTNGSERQLRGEEPSDIREWARELPPELHLRFGQNLLSRIGVDPRFHEILETIADRYGLPRRPRIERFWEPVDEETKVAFQRRFIRHRIRDFFRSDIDRRDYWERWTDLLHDVQRNVVQGTEYGLLDFGAFGVVEFFENGNAAYFYSETRFQRIAARRVTAKTQLRETYRPILAPWSDNRFIHTPPRRGWYSRADDMVNQWIRFARAR